MMSSRQMMMMVDVPIPYLFVSLLYAKGVRRGQARHTGAEPAAKRLEGPSLLGLQCSSSLSEELLQRLVELAEARLEVTAMRLALLHELAVAHRHI